MGLNLTAAHTVIYLSNDFSLKTRLQSEDRVHRPGQIYPVSYFDMIATGPQGQKTIDHLVAKSLMNKEAIADLTTSAWISALTED
jgi:ATP-dependent DNA helicase